MIITVDLVGSVVHAAVVDVVADQLPRDAVGGVPALELGRVVAAGNVLEYNSIKYSSSVTIGENNLYLCPGGLEPFSPHGLVREVEGELEEVGLGEDLLVGVQSVSTQLYRGLGCRLPRPDSESCCWAASL